jgi:uncharacterized protein YukE
MPRVHHRKARKDYPDHNIKRGDMYYTWSLKTGPRSSRTYRQLSPPRRSQLTTSDFLSQLYDLEDRLLKLSGDTILDVTSEVEDIAGEIRQLGEEQQEKVDNMPDGLQQGDTGQMIQERAEACEQWASDLENELQNWPEDLEDADVSDMIFELQNTEYQG